MALLKVEKVVKRFGGLAALNEVSFVVNESEILGVIGPNGAGKTTVFNVITGFLDPASGRILFNGEEITGLRPDQVARRGITRTFQTSVLYMEATCFENVLMGFHMSYRQPTWKALLHTSAASGEEEMVIQKAIEILDLMGMAALKETQAYNLPHGQQRTLGIAIALATSPKLLLLDEPATGMNPKETSLLMEKVRMLREKGITIVLVEHDMKAIMGSCDRIVAFNFGEVIAEGSPHEIQENKQVIEAYLGKEFTLGA